MGLLDMLRGDLVVRDKATGESQTFTRTKSGYVAAREYEETILSAGHTVGDDGTGSLKDLRDYLGPPQTHSSWGGWGSNSSNESEKSSKSIWDWTGI